MIWFLIICGYSSNSSACTFSPPFSSKSQCEFAERQVQAISDEPRRTRCIAVRKS